MANLDAELEAFKRDINLVEFAVSLGYQLDSHESSRNSAVLRNGSDKIIVATDEDGHGIYFSVRDEQDNGTIIDFLQRREGLSLGHVRKALRPWTSSSYRPGRSIPAGKRYKKPEPSSADRQHVLAEYLRMQPQPAGGHPYLLSRFLTAPLLLDPRFERMIRIDGRGNAVFPHYDRQGLTGYELKNRGFTGFAKHGEKGLWFSSNLASAGVIVIVEAAIDALSHAQLFGGDAAYLSIGGQPNPKQPILLEGALTKAHARGAAIVIGTDADQGGDNLAALVNELAPAGANIERDRPPEGPRLKDWNDLLRQQAQAA